MLEFLKELLEDLKDKEESYCKYNFENYQEKVYSLETAIEILERMKN